MRGNVRLWAAVVIASAGGAVPLVLAGGATAISGTQPLAVVLCKFSDKTNEPNPASYYQTMFSETGAGQNGVYDYWKAVSYGQLDLTGTIVKGWYTLDQTVAQW